MLVIWSSYETSQNKSQYIKSESSNQIKTIAFVKKKVLQQHTKVKCFKLNSFSKLIL